MRRSTLDELAVPEPIRAALRRFVRELMARAGPQVLDVVLYGSVARGTQGPESDVDVLVAWNGAEGPARELLAEITTDLFFETRVFISARPMSRRHWDEMEGFAFHENVTREGVSVTG